MKLVLKTKLFLLITLAFIALPFFVFAEDFYVDSDYDEQGREEISADLKYRSNDAYFYVEDDWWDDLSSNQKASANTKLTELGEEFDNVIYPQLTDIYGEEWNPGIDNNRRVTVMFIQMQENVGGYFRNIDEYRKIQAPESNQREIVYLNVQVLFSDITEAYLAHEFTHLITFNQKNRLQRIEEDVWLNELRAEYAPTLLGYDSPYEETNLEKRIDYFILSPSDSLTEWKSEERDYGIINIFAQYLVEHYGVKILTDSLRSPYVGIASLNYALALNGFDKKMDQIFLDFVVTVLINDCDLGEEYCFSEEPLNYIRIAPNLLYLPSTQQASMSLVYAIKQWSGHWYKVIGGGKGLEVDFASLSDKNFNVAYLIQRNNKVEEVKFLELDDEQKGIIELPYFSQNNQSLIIIPLVSEKINDFSDSEPFCRFSLDIRTVESNQGSGDVDNGGVSDKPISELTIEELEQRIAEIIGLINALKQEIANFGNCSTIDNNLYYGLRSNSGVRCLQQFLNEQGFYPEGIVSGNFLELTKQAVIRFQEEYYDEILAPLGIENGTGYVGSSTREKINQLLTQ